MDINKLLIENYNNGFMFGDFTLVTSDLVEIKILKLYLRKIMFYFEAFFNFESSKENNSVTLNYNSKLVNYVILSSLKKNYDFPKSFNNSDIINLIKFVDEYGFIYREDLIKECERFISKHPENFIDELYLMDDLEMYKNIKSIIMNFIKKMIIYDEDNILVQNKLMNIKNSSEELSELNFINQCINNIMPSTGKILNKKIFNINKIKAKIVPGDTNMMCKSYLIQLNIQDMISSESRENKQNNNLIITSTICKILNKMFNNGPVSDGEEIEKEKLDTLAELLDYKENNFSFPISSPSDNNFTIKEEEISRSLGKMLDDKNIFNEGFTHNLGELSDGEGAEIFDLERHIVAFKKAISDEQKGV